LIEFDWDAENILHIALHNVTPDEVEYILTHPTVDFGYQEGYNEDRFAEAGATATGRILEIITTPRGLKTRVVTAYDADPGVVKAYYLSRRFL
jgi:uncharacterized DUF497 family protein